MPVREESANDPRERRLVAIWLAAALGVLAFPLVGWLRIPAGYRWLVPASPLDQTRPDTAAQLAFLWRCRPLLPIGARCTVVAEDWAVEQSLFMMSLGVLPDLDVFPTRYNGIVVPRSWVHPDYVLAYRCASPDPLRVQLVGRVGGGCVFRALWPRPSP